MHNQGEPWIIVVDPLMISLLKYNPGGFVKRRVRDQHSRKAETTFLSFSIFKTCWIVVFTVHLPGYHDVEYIQHHCFFKGGMISRYRWPPGSLVESSMISLGMHWSHTCSM